MKLQCPGPCLPHICALRFESSQAFPPNWKLARTVPRRQPLRVETVCPKAHRVLEQGLAGKPLEIEVLRAGEAVLGGSAASNELLQHPDGSGEATTPWVARLSALLEGDRLDSELLELSPRRLRQLLVHAQTLISDFRQMDGVDRAWLEAEWCETVALGESLDVLLGEAETSTKWRRFAELYVTAYGLRKRIALSNPLVNFDQLLVVRRGVTSPALGLPQNWQSNCVLPTSGYDDEIGRLSLHTPGAQVKTLYRPQTPVFVGDIDLHFDADRLLFSSVNNAGQWQVFEIQVEGTGLRQVTRGEQPDVNNYDACYLPDGRILFCSTASVTAVPCVNGSTTVANLYRTDANGEEIRQLCFDQEHNWCPTVLESGRVLYLRWEYTDTPHAHDRVLFSMNPDGTEQREFYGSNSYWPNSLFYARPIPGAPGQFIGIVGGHHGVPRMGDLVLFDIARGHREAEGVVEQIPGRGKKVEARIEDQLVDNSWPKFLHPYPLSDKYFLVASQPGPGSLWGIYLVDRFDGMVLLKEEPGYALLEPIPLRKTPRPPVIPDRIDPTRKDALLYIADIYEGEGLQGVPRGTVKRLRLLTYHFLYPGMGGPQGVVGMEGPWDIKRIIGSVPVEEDGSALFRIPANTPISLQPLDAEGKALQLMRSWLTAMPGEVLSCVGCHENQNAAPPATLGLVASRPPAEITPWYGPLRGFNFAREVQPVLDKHCVCCHRPDSPANHDGRLADLRGTQWIQDYTSLFHYGGQDAGHFTVSYAELHRYVRRPGLESDYHTLVPLEFHADTTELVRMLARGHHGVRLDAEAWDRLITWIDLNAPFHGTWSEIAGPERVKRLAERRRELLKLYAGVDDDPEAIPPSAAYDSTPRVPPPNRRRTHRR